MGSTGASSTCPPQPPATPGAVVQPSCFPLTLKRQQKIPEIIYLSLGRAVGPFVYLSKSKYTQESKETKRTGPKRLSCAHWMEGRLWNHWALPTWHVNEESLGCGLQADVLGCCCYLPCLLHCHHHIPGLINSWEIIAKFPRETLSASVAVKHHRQAAEGPSKDATSIKPKRHRHISLGFTSFTLVPRCLSTYQGMQRVTI